MSGSPRSRQDAVGDARLAWVVHELIRAVDLRPGLVSAHLLPTGPGVIRPGRGDAFRSDYTDAAGLLVAVRTGNCPHRRARRRPLPDDAAAAAEQVMAAAAETAVPGDFRQDVVLAAQTASALVHSVMAPLGHAARLPLNR